MARKNLFGAPGSSGASTPHAPSRPPLPVGSSAVSPLALMRRDLGNLVRDVPTDKIESSRWRDRMDQSDPEFEALVCSIRERGQLVPALVRPVRGKSDRYEIVYGRRRLAAAIALGQPLKVIVSELKDEEAILAQGIENSQRLDLSYIERALFAQTLLDDAEMPRDVIADTIGAHVSELARTRGIIEAVGLPFIEVIGPCHGTGRRAWLELSEACKKARALGFDDAAFVQVDLSSTTDGDARLAAALVHVHQMIDEPEPPAPAASKPLRPTTEPSSRRVVLGDPGHRILFDVDMTRKGLKIQIPVSGQPDGLTDWLRENRDVVLNDIYERWRNDTRKPS
ncbi:plasmid partitioning protein RepB [Pararhodobacter sp. CCB-MM2]|uniref:plasmid partitioning protein RepB n=1 Tax=Pararhodobacter sp. CCB-MM2 TaxID=1786003 RepID=UPI000836DB55|nr:plasmid partitioning protein RepB [Pararhodobacter sp. CCB-MM2]